jgi:hypothetical protein
LIGRQLIVHESERIVSDLQLKKMAGLSLTSWIYIGHDPKEFRNYESMPRSSLPPLDTMA